VRIFDHPNTEFGWKCPVCKQDDDKKITLLSKYGTRKGNIVEAEQVHIDCLDLWIYEDEKVIGMSLRGEK